MPGTDGWETTRHLRKHGVPTPVVALTASALQDDRESAAQAGMDLFLSKPIVLASLEHTLAQCRQLALTAEGDPNLRGIDQDIENTERLGTT